MMLDNLRITDNRIKFVKYRIIRMGRDPIEVFSDEQLKRITNRFDEKETVYNVEELENSSDMLALEGVKVLSWNEALERVNGTYEPPVDRLAVVEDAVLELAGMVAEVVSNG